MSWTRTERSRGVSHLDFFTAELNREGYEIVDASSVGSVIYCAVRRPAGVGAIVIRTRWSPGYVTNYWYQVEEETWPPYGAKRCPQRILDQLDPPQSVYQDPQGAQAAVSWRASCDQQRSLRAGRPAVSDGDIVIFTKAIVFSRSGTHDEFVFRYGSTFTLLSEPDGGEYIIHNWRDREYKVLGQVSTFEPEIEMPVLSALAGLSG